LNVLAPGAPGVKMRELHVVGAPHAGQHVSLVGHPTPSSLSWPEGALTMQASPRALRGVHAPPPQ
jgi:hypothetical protein